MNEEIDHQTERQASRLHAEATKATERVVDPPRPDSDPVEISFDWIPNVDHGRIRFQLVITRHDQTAATDFAIDLHRLGHDDLEQVRDLLGRRQAGTDDGYAVTRAITWLVDLSLVQQQPDLGKSDRDRKVRQLLLAQSYDPEL